LSAAGVKITTLTTDHEFALYGAADTPEVLDGVRRFYARKWLSPYKVAPGLVPQLLRCVPAHDVVHIHGLFTFSTTASALAARHRGVPYIVRPLGSLYRYGLHTRRPRLKRLSLTMVEGPILRGAAAVHFTSQAERDEASAIGQPMRGVVIPLGVDADDGPPVAPLQHAALAGRRAILFLAQLDPRKNLEALIDAIAASLKLRDTCALVVAGAGEPGYVASLKARAEAAGLSDRTLWLGHVEGAQKRAVLAAADLFVLPSFMENFGIAVVEALLAGLPCVLGEGVAIASAIERSGAGITVPPEASAVAHAMERILDDGPAFAHAMGLRARQLAESEFSTAAMVQRLIALYEEVRRTRPGPETGLGAQVSPHASADIR